MYLLLRYHSSVLTELSIPRRQRAEYRPNIQLVIRKSVVSVNLRSQPWNATVSIHKIAQLLPNIVTFSHGAALQTNHRASFNHVSHGEPRWLCFGCAMQIISVVTRYLVGNLYQFVD